MKYAFKLLLYITAPLLFFAACKKSESLPFYKSGAAPVLKSSVSTIAAAPADSSSTVVVFSWTNPNYAADSTKVKYILQIDSSGRNFSQADTFMVTGALSTSLTAKQINDILLNYGFAFGATYNMDVRIVSSYANNNDQQLSNTLTIKMTPYKIPPKVMPPPSGTLFLVGNATAGGWSNPVPVPSQQFARFDSVTYGGVFKLSGGNQYLVLPVNGDWSHKYSVADNSVPGLSAGGGFGYDQKDNFPGPANSGWYSIVIDFQHGIFTVTPFSKVLPDSLFIVGGATAGGWSNPVPEPSQVFTRLNCCQFALSVPLTGGGQYLLLPVNGSWSSKFAVADNTITGLSAGGSLGYYTSGGANIPAPATSDNYKINVDFVHYTFAVGK